MPKLKSLQKPLALAVLFALGWGWLQLSRLATDEVTTHLPNQHGEPDYVIQQAEVFRYNELGQRLQKINAQEVVSYPEKNLVELIQPKLTHYQNATPSWLIESETGKYLQATAQQAETTILNHQVVITPLNPASSYTPQLFTESLQLDHALNLASTNHPVSFISPSGKTYGKGLKLDFNAETAIIENQVEGSYLPANQHPSEAN